MPILGFTNSAANKDMIAKIWTYGDTIICSSEKHSEKSGNCWLWAPYFQKLSVVDVLKISIYRVKG